MMTTMMPMPRKNTKTTTQKANGAAAAATVRKPNIQTNIETTRSTLGVQKSNWDTTKSSFDLRTPKPDIQTNIETTGSTFGVQRSNQDATKSKS